MGKIRKFIHITKNQHKLLRIKLQETPERYNSKAGEVDILIDSAKNTYFDLACLQTRQGRIFCDKPINAISWHGFYDERQKIINLPVINFKDKHEKIWCPRHNGVVRKKDVFLFPICSCYIPANMRIANVPTVPVGDESNYVVELNKDCNVRVDFFVLPKGISMDDFISNILHFAKKTR